MSVRELFPFFKWGFNIRRSNFLVPILSNNIIVTGEEAVSFEKPLPATREPNLNHIERAILTSSGNTIVEEVKLPSSSNDTKSQLLSTSPQLSKSQTPSTNPPSPIILAEKGDCFKPASPEMLVKDDTKSLPSTPSIQSQQTNILKVSNSSTATTSTSNLSFSPSMTVTTPPPSPSTSYSQLPIPINTSQNSLPASVKLAELTNQEIIERVEQGLVQLYKLEAELGDCSRAVEIRRIMLEKNLGKQIEQLPHQSYDYEKVQGACCENVIGYVPIPVGAAGPIQMNGSMVVIPMATTEGCLVASTHRGCRAITESGGAKCTVFSRGMTRAPVVRFPNIMRVGELVQWLNEPENYERVKSEFDSTSRFAKLSSVKTTVAGRSVYIRFKCDTGDAMGMNMVSKGVEAVLNMLKCIFNEMEVLSLSGNMCTDKKPSAVNWIDGRGRSVVCEAVINGDIVQKVLKTSVQALVDLNIQKNLVGSAMAGSIGGFNAHASNIVTAIFLATGQDCAQNVESSNCITLMEPCNDGRDLYMTVTMPSIEVGTVGGGTFLPAQSQCLDIIGVKGSAPNQPAGSNADQLAKTVCAAVMAGELSLMAALSAGHLMKSHLQYNRKQSIPSNLSSLNHCSSTINLQMMEK